MDGNAAQQGIEISDGKEAAEMDVADLREAVALSCSESLDGNCVGALDGRLALPEAAVDTEAGGHCRIDSGMAQQATAALVDRHGHHAAPEKANRDGNKDKYRTVDTPHA